METGYIPVSKQVKGGWQPTYKKRIHDGRSVSERELTIGSQLYPTKEEANKIVSDYTAGLDSDAFNCEDPSCPLPKPHLHAIAQ